MAGRLYRMAKVVSANPKSWGIVDANEISGFKRVAKLADLYSIAECILSSSYGDGVTDGADAVGQIWHVSETNGDYKLTNWASRKSAAGWTKLSYGGDVSVPVKDVQVTKDGTTASVLSNGIANIDLTDYAKKSDVTNNLKNYITQAEKGIRGGVAPLDRDNMIPLQYLGHLDMTVFTVVESLPTNDIENKVYLVKSSVTDDKNNYAEYIYTGDRNGVYDATKWEKLGEVAAKTDLSEYYKKTEVYNKTEINDKVDTLDHADIKNFTITPSSRGVQGGSKLYYMQASITRKGADPLNASIPCVVSAADTTNANAGLMSPADKQKLDGIAANANNYAHPSHTAAATTEEYAGLYKVIVDDLGHVTKTTAVDKNDITALGIPGSAPTVDAAMSEISTNAVQNKVIDSAIKTHKVNNSNFKDSNDVAYSGNSLLFYSQISDGITYHDIHNASYRIVKTTDGIPKIAYSANGSTNNSYLLRDIDMVALTDGELNEILK